MLPLSNDELLETLVLLCSDSDEDVRQTSSSTLGSTDPLTLAALAADEDTSPDVLGFLLLWPNASRDLLETLIFNKSTPDEALAQLAGKSPDASIIEAVSLKQQSLIRLPSIIEAIMANPARTPEAERRAREVQQEFFEKRFGADLVASEERARREAAAEPDDSSVIRVGSLEELIQLGLIDPNVDDSFVDEYESEYGPFDEGSGVSLRVVEIDDIIQEIETNRTEPEKIAPERVAVFQRIAVMTVKERVMLAIKGSREARTILVRDPNKIVSTAVLRNPRLTDAEIESIAGLRTVPEDVLRQIGQNRAWTKSYAVIHNLVRNPRTPIAISLGFLNRIQTRDLRIVGSNKNIPDVIRTTASRLFIKRSSG